MVKKRDIISWKAPVSFIFMCNVDIDECTEQPGICGPQGNCRNTPGEYVCECGDGYVPDPNGKNVT